uniref:Immunoglobulin V-set domain-containing protein n=1 Tax=Haplochromis burtoni TaxID=8153 RepID=A0A3Q2VV76_HAPBU
MGDKSHLNRTMMPLFTFWAEKICHSLARLSSRGVHWYKQSFGGTLKLIVTVFKSTEPTFGPEFTSLKFDIGDDFASLTILKADQDDEGIYHCANTERIGVKWSGTYLVILQLSSCRHCWNSTFARSRVSFARVYTLRALWSTQVANSWSTDGLFKSLLRPFCVVYP